MMTQEPPKNFQEVKIDFKRLGLPFPSLGCPSYSIPTIGKLSPIRINLEPPALAMPGSNLSRSVNFLADYGGCGWWRCGAPEMLLNYNQKMIVSSLTSMIADPRFYLSGFKSVKFQRQATPMQLEFNKMVKQMGSKHDFRIIYEVDDVVFDEDIPLFNRCRDAFTDPIIKKSIKEMLELCDEFVVVSEYMKDYYKSKISNKKITCIPNYAPRMWFDRYYNEEKLAREYEKNKKRPRILATPSGTHFDVLNKVNQKDDYAGVIEHMIKTRKDFKWVFIGGFPIFLKPFIDSGEMEFINWVQLLEFPQAMYDSNTQVSMAALADNNFNRAKSYIKWSESAHLGIPFIGQNMEPYKQAAYKFNNGNELIDHIKKITKDETTYMEACKFARKSSDPYWLDNEKNLMQHVELYTTPYGSLERKYLLETNPEQTIKK